MNRGPAGRPTRFDRSGGLSLGFGSGLRDNILGGRGRNRSGGRREEVDDLAERAKGPEVLGFDNRRLGKLLLQSGEDFDAFDGVDAEVGVEKHVRLEHLGGIPGLLRHHRQ